MLLIRNKQVRMAFGFLETLNFLQLRLAFKNPRRATALPGRIFRDYMALAGSDRWQSRDIFDIIELPPHTRITLEHHPGAGINAPVDELAYLALMTRAVAPSQIFEIGTFRGRTALNFALNSPDDCVVWTLDLPPSEREAAASRTNWSDAAIISRSLTGVDYQGRDVAGKIRQLFGNSLTFDFTPYLSAMDLVFVDGAHHYEAARADTRTALKLVRPGGFVVWHDFANYGDYNDVTRAVLDTLPGQEVVQIANSQLAVYRRPDA